MGYSREELLALRGSRHPAAGVWPACSRTLRARSATEGPFTFEAVHLRKGGELFPAEVSAQLSRLPGPAQCYCAFARDITSASGPRRLRESEERYHSLFEGVPVGLYRTTPAGRMLDANSALVRILGFPT